MCTLQSLTGKYRGLQGNPCNENRDPAMRTGVPCNENRFSPVGIDSQGVPCELYRVWVCSVKIILRQKQFFKLGSWLFGVFFRGTILFVCYSKVNDFLIQHFLLGPCTLWRPFEARICARRYFFLHSNYLPDKFY